MLGFIVFRCLTLNSPTDVPANPSLVSACKFSLSVAKGSLGGCEFRG